MHSQDVEIPPIRAVFRETKPPPESRLHFTLCDGCTLDLCSIEVAEFFTGPFPWVYLTACHKVIVNHILQNLHVVYIHVI